MSASLFLNPTPGLSGAQALQAAQAQGVPRLDAQWLLLHALGQPVQARAWLLAHDAELLDAAAATRFAALCKRHLAGEPLAYLLGQHSFFGLDLTIDARVLVPRADTETLVHWALDCLQACHLPSCPSIADLGTGSGAIALALAQQLQGAGRTAHITAIDASADALQVAQANGQRLGLQVQWVHSNWLTAVHQKFDLIASNPPYIASADPHLAALSYEPLQALVSGADGLDALRHIIAQAPAHLQRGGWLLLENGYDQAHAVQDLLHAQGFSQIQSRQDLAGIARCSGGQWGAGAHAI